MQRHKPFRQLRAEQREGRHAAHRRQMAGAGIVADEQRLTGRSAHQFRHVARRGHARLARLPPPVPLVGVAGDLHAKIFSAAGAPRAAGSVPAARRGWAARRRCGSRSFPVAPGGHGNFFARRQIRAPVRGRGRARIRSGAPPGAGRASGPRQKNPAAAGAESRGGCCAPKIFRSRWSRTSRIAAARREAEVKAGRRQSPAQPDNFPATATARGGICF